MNEDDLLLAVMLFVLLFFVATTCYFYKHFKYATKLYCQYSCSNNVVEYEQCKKTDLVILLQEKRKINAR